MAQVRAFNPPQPADSQVAALKLPPHSIEAEQSLIGGLLIDNAAWDRIGDVVRETDFYRDDHRRIFRHIGKLIQMGRPADVVTVYESIEQSNEVDQTGGLGYLGEIANATPSAANIRRYAEIVRERAILRQLVTVGDEIAGNALNPAGRDVKALLDDAEQRIFQIAEAGNRSNNGFVPIQPLLGEVVERMETLLARDSQSDITGVATGFVDLDRLTAGLQPGDMLVVAGRPSMGKAQPLDARVRTPHGWKEMGDLAVGDALASVDGAPSIVTGVFPQGEKQIYRVTFSDGRSTECCAEHLWRVHYRDWDHPRTVTTKTLIEMLQRVRYRSRLWIDMASGDFGHNDNLPMDPWLLGALLGDGSLCGTSLRFSNVCAEVLDRVRERIESTMELVSAGRCDYRIVRTDRGHVADVAGGAGNPLKKALEDMGLWGATSELKFIPQCYLDATREVRLELLRGLLDTDGWVERWGSIRLSTASRRLADDVALLVRSLGGWCSIIEKAPRYTYKGESMAGRPAYVCHISHPEPRSLVLMSEKQGRLPERWTRQKRLTVKSIEPTRMAAAQCISVSHGSRLYLTDDYVVTHNTAFALNIAEHVGVELRLPVAIFSLEMSGPQLATRFLSSVGRIDQTKLRTGRLTDDEWDRMTVALGKLHEAPIHIDETGAINSTDLRARARRLHRQFGKLGLIIIDYLQLMSSNRDGENRATEISEISRSIKALAKELQVPIIALSQLSRKVEERNDKRPLMSDLRESGAIEQDADIIMMMYREEYYKPDTQDKGVAEVIITKHRNGPTDTVRLTFLGEYTKFENFASGSSYRT
jgi:replicative DNA helicase